MTHHCLQCKTPLSDDYNGLLCPKCRANPVPYIDRPEKALKEV